jgi:hypothetical protein
MSQAVEPAPATQSQASEFNYRPVPVLAPVSLVLGLCGAMALLAAFGVVIAFLGTILGSIAFLRIRRAGGDLGGGWLAGIGLGLSSIFLVSGISLQSYGYATELPEGHIRVNFPHDISRKQFVYQNGRTMLHPDVELLVDQNIFLKGYMRPSKKINGLTAFELLKDNGKCCFGGEPAAWDSILVLLSPGETVDYSTGLISVAGRLSADFSRARVYTIDATHVERSRTSF